MPRVPRCWRAHAKAAHPRLAARFVLASAPTRPGLGAKVGGPRRGAQGGRAWGSGLAGWLCLAVVLAAPLGADDFPAPFNTGMGADQQPLPPAEAAQGMNVPPGFRVTVFAAEPEVNNPVAMTWDRRGRLWVAECYTYGDRQVRYDLSLRDRVLIFTDRDGDGQADERKVFCDNVQRLMSVEVGLGGVWLIALPQLLFVPDRDGDDRPDGPPQVILDGFGINPVNYHNGANGLRFGPDGWLYGRCGASGSGWVGPPGAAQAQRVPLYGGLWRYHPQRGAFEVLCHGTTNPWGHDWDAHGELFFTNTVTGHLFHLIPGAHYTRSATVSPNPRVYQPIDTHADHYHWDTTRGWRVVEGDAVRDQLGGGHAHCGALIYQDMQWPAALHGKLLTLNLHGRRINVDALQRQGSGYVGRHVGDMAQAADPWFRGIDLTSGPDGAVYVLDWSDTGECHEHDGVHRLSGRIFRIAFGPTPPQPPADLTRLPPKELVALHGDPRQWWVRQARRELAERAAAGQRLDEAVAALQEGLRDTQRSVVERLNILWTLATLRHCPATGSALPPEELRRLRSADDEHLRAWGWRLATDFWPLDSVFSQPAATAAQIDPALADTLPSAAAAEPSALVRLVLASLLQRLPPERRAALAAALTQQEADAQDANLPKLVWYGLAPLVDHDPLALASLATTARWPLTRQWIARALAEQPVKNHAALEALLRAASTAPAAVQEDVLRGLVAGLAGRRKVDPPASWTLLASRAANGSPEMQEMVRTLSVVFGDGRALDEVRRIALDDQAPLAQRRAALETLIEARPDDLASICQRLLKVRFLNTVALRGLTLFDDPDLGQQLARSYAAFHPTDQPAVIAALATRPAFARALLEQIGQGRIPRSDLSPLVARQIRSFQDETLTALLRQVWGELRDSPAEKQALIAQWRARLTPGVLATADLARGRAVFQTTCANCHRLFGSGGTIGPDLTGSQRQQLEYLLENILDPSAVVNKDYRMSVLRLTDGRVLSGLVLREDEERVVLQTPTEQFTLLRSEIEEQKLTELSPMPDGLLQTLSPEQVRDLVAYLMAPGQVELPPGVPASGGGR
jgi:putative membrane-bound dehydrogenase-like protein